MAILHMERIGGVAGFGTSRARLRSHGQFDMASLSHAEVQVVEQLFQTSTSSAISADAFSLRLTRTGVAGTESVVVPESAVPATMLKHLQDELL